MPLVLSKENGDANGKVERPRVLQLGSEVTRTHFRIGDYRQCQKLTTQACAAAELAQLSAVLIETER